MADILPEKFGYRDETAYKQDVIALRNGEDPRGLKEDSIINDIQHFHCARTGSLAPCMMHDVFCGELSNNLLFVKCSL